MCIKINKVGKQEVGIWWVQKRYPRYGIPIWRLWPNIRFLPSIFPSNYWWQESDIWSQASYRYAILWEAFLDPSDSFFLFADLVVTLVTKYQISAINSYWEKCDEKYLGRTEGRTEVKQYTPLPLRGEGV
jgi:hypothetical protein